jgi:quercetin dioxygenase-like cupin family protein
MSQFDSTRLRPHPEERFGPPQHLIDWEAAARELAAEPPHANGRRQKTLYRHGPMSVALFLFDAGAKFPEHRAEGVVTLQALSGRLTIQAEGEHHELAVGRMLVLAPLVKHSVAAEEASRMLLTVHMEPAPH